KTKGQGEYTSLKPYLTSKGKVAEKQTVMEKGKRAVRQAPGPGPYHYTLALAQVLRGPTSVCERGSASIGHADPYPTRVPLRESSQSLGLVQDLPQSSLFYNTLSARIALEERIKER
ncbi:hypothetical protein Tco_1416578, partial [Tanacetum coccineum]